MTLTVVGVRHHSPACARLVRAAIAELEPAYVLVEGPADMNARLGELVLGHELPVAVFTSYRDPVAGFSRSSWSPFCEYSPEWVAVTEGLAAGAEVRFIDLPAWHPAFAARTNRYADAELRYAQAVDSLCGAMGMDNADTLWDHLAEIDAGAIPDAELTERLTTYFDLLRAASDAVSDARGTSEHDDGSAERLAPEPDPGSDEIREAYMARWIAAALAAAGDRPVLVVCGGFHRPALLRRVAGLGALRDAEWPEVPDPAGDASAVSHLVPYSFRRLDSFDGYQSGMPSPAYYQRVWEVGPRAAAAALTEDVVTRLRARRQPVSTADVIAARVTAEGLAAVRGHRHPGRADLLDGLVSALVGEALDRPLPWTGRGRLPVGTHPAVVEMVAALSGTRTGRLHPDTPLPPLVHDAVAELERHGLDGTAVVTLDLTRDDERAASRLLNRLRVLAIPGFRRDSGPKPGADEAELREQWSLRRDDDRLPALIEAGGLGPTVAEAARARIAERIAGPITLGDTALALFDAVLCGITDMSDAVLADLGAAVAAEGDLGQLGSVLGSVLSLWRHDRLMEAAGSAMLGAVVAASVERTLWLAEGMQGPTLAAEPLRISAVRAARDAVLFAGAALGLDRPAALAVMTRIAADPGSPPDLRGAAYGFCWSLDDGRAARSGADRAIRGAAAPETLGDWLAGLFALAREQVLEATAVLGVLDEIVTAMSERDLLVALPALRQAFAYFPPRERETIADHVVRLHGGSGTGRTLLRKPVRDPMAVARARELDAHVQELLAREGLVP